MNRPLTPRLALLAADRIGKAAAAEQRALTNHEAGAVAALREIAGIPQAPKVAKAPGETWRDAPIPFPIGTSVMFKSFGRGGTSPFRGGTIVGAKRTCRGVILTVNEDGAVPSCVIGVRPGMVKARGRPGEGAG